MQALSVEIFAQAATSPQDELTAVRPVIPYEAAKACACHMAGSTVGAAFTLPLASSSIVSRLGSRWRL